MMITNVSANARKSSTTTAGGLICGYQSTRHTVNWSHRDELSVLKSMFELFTTKHLRGHNLKLVKHRSNLELRRNFFTERLINRWNGLDQQSLDVDSINCFKNHLQRLRNTRMGFFVD